MDTEREASTALVVDDDAAVCELAARILEMDGYRVRMAFDGEEAWDAIQQETPAVVLTDFLMPRLDGLELADRLLGVPRRIPIVIMSGVYEGIAIPGVHFIRKPFRPEELTQAVGRALAEVANRA
jgi:CheY-like chemotaxis protein